MEDYSAGPTVSSLLESVESTTTTAQIDTTCSGYMHKRGYRFSNLLTCCPSCCGCGPTWKKRFFVLRGGFLFRFTSNTRTARSKGTPIPLTDATFVCNAEMENNTSLSVLTVRKDYVLRAETTEQRNEWLNKLRTAKQISIKVRLGHALDSSVDRRAREAGERLCSAGARREKRENEMRNPAWNCYM